MKCLAKHQLDCFLSQDYDFNKCITNQYRSVFDMYSNTSLQKCQTEAESKQNYIAMTKCYFSENTTNNCLDPCNIEIYAENSYIIEKMKDKRNMTLIIKYESMAIKVSEEYFVYDFANFIGTLGGSLGLFIGFSYTGLIGSIIDILFEKFQIE